MPLAKNGKLTTISLAVSRRLDAAIRAEHARRVEAYERERGHRRGAPSLSSVWEEYAREGFVSRHPGIFDANLERDVA